LASAHVGAGARSVYLFSAASVYLSSNQQ